MTMREVMLGIAEAVLNFRESLDDGGNDDYDAVKDPEGYTVSILCALRHWTHAHGRDWFQELARAEELFQEDLLGLDD